MKTGKECIDCTFHASGTQFACQQYHWHEVQHVRNLHTNKESNNEISVKTRTRMYGIPTISSDVLQERIIKVKGLAGTFKHRNQSNLIETAIPNQKHNLVTYTLRPKKETTK